MNDVSWIRKIILYDIFLSLKNFIKRKNIQLFIQGSFGEVWGTEIIFI